MRVKPEYEALALEGSELSSAFELLCAHFDEELVRQRAVLDSCRAQGEAARAHDLDALQTATEGLVGRIQEALEAEKERLALLHRVVAELGLEEERQSLTSLIEGTPEPWHSRMKTFQVAIRGVIEATQAQVRKDSGYLRRAERIIERSVRTVLGRPEMLGEAYDKAGNEPGAMHHAPTLVNTVG